MASAKILVVDDREPARLAYREHLRSLEDVHVLEANGGPRALEYAREHDFAMFLLDVALPDIDGFELATLLRQQPRAESTPIMFVTGDDGPRAQPLHGYNLGPVDILVPAPVPAGLLVQQARIFLQMYRKRAELQQVVARVQQENGELHERLAAFVKEQDAVRLQATHDPVTRLPNRTLLFDRLGAALTRASRNRQRFAVAYAELDGLQAAHDRHGRAAADAVARTVAERLTRFVRASDTVARVGGGKFAVVFEGLDSPEAVERVSQKLARLLAEPVRWIADGAEVEVKPLASIGLALFPDHALSAEELDVLADMTLYAVRRNGGGVMLYPGHAGQLPRGRA